MVWVAPSSVARASLSSLDEVMMACRPAARASCSPSTETPPVPSSSTVSPGRMLLLDSKMAFQAVTPAQAYFAGTQRAVGKVDALQAVDACPGENLVSPHGFLR